MIRSSQGSQDLAGAFSDAEKIDWGIAVGHSGRPLPIQSDLGGERFATMLLGTNSSLQMCKRDRDSPSLAKLSEDRLFKF
jgi:hypothetical protein